MLLTLSFFPSKNFFLHLSNLKRIHFAPKLCKKKKKNIYIYICIGRRARSRAKDHRTSFPDPKIEKQYRVGAHSSDYVSFMRNTGCAVQN